MQHVFFKNVPEELAFELESLSRLLYELKNSRTKIYVAYQVNDEDELLNKIIQRQLAEHPAYNDYLGLCTIGQTIQAVREEILKLSMAGV